MAAMSTLTLHERADQAAAKGDFLGALRHVGEALRVSPLDARARIKVALCLAALGRPDKAIAALVVTAESLLRRGFVLSAIGACRDGLSLQPGAPEIRGVLERIHARIQGLEGRGRARVPPPTTPGSASEKDSGSLLGISDGGALLERAVALAVTDPDPQGVMAEPGPVPLFSDLSKESFLSLVERMGYHKVGAGHVVVREGDAGASLFIIVQGEVEVTRGAGDAAQVMARLGAGSLFGELALIRAKPRTATVRTTQPAELLEIARQNVEEVAAANASITEDLVRFARRRLIMNLMATSKIFTPFDDAQRLQVLRAFVTRLVEPNTVVIQEGQEPSGLFVILEGEVEVSKIDPGGDKVVLAYLRESEVFGEIGLVTKRLTTATVTASDKSVLLYLDRSRFAELTQNHPKILEYLASVSDARLEETNQAMAADGVVLDADDLIIL